VRSLSVMVVNDEDREVTGPVTLALDNLQAERVTKQVTTFKIAPLGQEKTLTQSRRHVEVVGGQPWK
jgi:hypothetical protein